MDDLQAAYGWFIGIDTMIAFYDNAPYNHD
jgi:hypothetical protein